MTFNYLKKKSKPNSKIEIISIHRIEIESKSKFWSLLIFESKSKSKFFKFLIFESKSISKFVSITSPALMHQLSTRRCRGVIAAFREFLKMSARYVGVVNAYFSRSQFSKKGSQQYVDIRTHCSLRRLFPNSQIHVGKR